MRLGGYGEFLIANDIKEIDCIIEKIDCYGLSAILAPSRLLDFTEEECIEFGLKAQKLGLKIGEIVFPENLLISDKEIQLKRIKLLQKMLKNADLMNCLSVISLVGTKDPSDYILAPHPYMFTDKCKVDFVKLF